MFESSNICNILARIVSLTCPPTITSENASTSGIPFSLWYYTWPINPQDSARCVVNESMLKPRATISCLGTLLVLSVLIPWGTETKMGLQKLYWEKCLWRAKEKEGPGLHWEGIFRSGCQFNSCDNCKEKNTDLGSTLDQIMVLRNSQG